MRPTLFAVVDTEEEFDWSAPFSRTNTSVRAMRAIGTLQAIFASGGVVPTYVVDFPIASRREAYSALREFARDGQARIGAHLHPWVNPPFTEDVTVRTSFGCALGEAVETAKIRLLKATIAESFALEPRVYKAGRYGFGPTTASAIESLGFDVDVSVNPRMNFTSEGGPTFEDLDARPFVFGARRRLLEIPCTTDYTGIAASFAPRLHRLISRPACERLHIPGILSRLGIVNRIMLSPEGATLAEMKALTRSLLGRGVRTFSVTLHSPSLLPGCTPYVRTASELGHFLDRLRGYLDFFLGDLGGVTSTPEAFHDAVIGARGIALGSSAS